VAGRTEIIISSLTPLNYSFNCEIIYDNPDTTEDLATMPVLSSSLSTQTYLVGFTCKTDYFRLNVISGGAYTIVCETQDVGAKPFVNFYTEDGTHLYASQATLSLTPGVYYIKISFIYDIVIYRIKYEAVIDQGKTLDFSIATYTGTDYLTNANVPVITGIMPTKNSRIFHKFIISQPSLVFINCWNEEIELFNEQMKKISFEFDENPDYYRLDPGTYYLRVIYSGEQINYSYSFPFCILSNEPVDDYPSNTFGTIVLNNPNFINLEFDGDIDYYHFSVLEAKNYYFSSSMNFALYTAKGQLVIIEGNNFFGFKDIEKELNAGEYYFVFFNAPGMSEVSGLVSVRDAPFS